MAKATETKKGKFRGFRLFEVRAESQEKAMKKARKEAQDFGDTVKSVKLKEGENPKAKMKTYVVFGGKK